MAIKIKTRRAEITETFIHEYRRISAVRLKTMHEEIRTANQYIKDSKKRELQPKMARLVPIVRGDAGDGTRAGMDYELARLRMMNFEKFDVIEANDAIGKNKRWLVGITRDIIAAEMRNAGGKKAGRYAHQSSYTAESVISAYWNIGPYMIAFDIDRLEMGSLEMMHLIPMKSMMSRVRHMHHKASPTVHSNNNPMGMEPSTCWGAVGSIATAQAQDGDIAELFQTMNIYLQRFNMHSILPPASLAALDWKVPG